ncbi:MAG: flagellar motor protein [Deltaproteobacteria bacterium]|nr:flagellar motor protein [Deltaproteobacteria bacterium]
MDIATIIGLILGVGAIVGGQILEGGSLHSITQGTAAFIVFGGTFGAVFVSFPLKDIIGAVKSLGTVLSEPKEEPYQIIAQITSFANKARKEGILSLEKDVQDIEHPFLKKALMLAIDGIEPKSIRETMETELEYTEEYGAMAGKIFESAGGYAPTIGILGAVLGLIHVMENLDDPSKLGPGIAVAFVATVYGVGAANLIFLPIGNKLKLRNRDGIITKEMMLEGVVAVSIGENPRIIEEKLKSFLSEAAKENPPPKAVREKG